MFVNSIQFNMIIFLNNKYLPLEEANISPLDRGFLFADGVYEFLRTYNCKLFRFDDHYNRLKYSAEELGLAVPGKGNLKYIINELVTKNHFSTKEYSVYIQITRGASFPRLHKFPVADCEQTMLIWLSNISSNGIENENGVKTILLKDLRWGRCDIKSISLLPNVLAKQKAVESNAVEAILMREGYITEGSHTNVFLIKNSVVSTAPLSNFVLNGITRKVVIELCKNHELKISERNILIDEILGADEIFLTGTSTEIKPVVEVNGVEINKGLPGEITKIIQHLFYDYVKEN